MNRILPKVLVSLALMLGSLVTLALGGEPKEKPVVEQILDLLLQRGQISQEEYRTLQEKARNESASAVLAGIEKGKPFLKSANGNFQVQFGGRIQADFHAAEEDARMLSRAEIDSQFLIRRSRFEVDGLLFRFAGFKIEADFTEGVSLKDAYVDLRFFPELRFRAGQFKVPFSLEELTSSRFIDFVERSIVNELAPTRDRGVMLYGDLAGGMVSYALGSFNGTGEDTSDNNTEYDLAARVAFTPF